MDSSPRGDCVGSERGKRAVDAHIDLKGMAKLHRLRSTTTEPACLWNSLATISVESGSGSSGYLVLLPHR
jgi:hypothetical protein